MGDSEVQRLGPRPGRLVVVCGPMFAGKTTMLMQLMREHAQGAQGIAIKHVRDTRYHATSLATHDGKRHEAIAVQTAHEVLAAVADAPVLAIDEAHFFGEPLAAVCLRLIVAGCDVLLAGIELDHFGEPFEPFPTLLAHADEVRKLTAPCAICGEPGTRTQRMTPTAGRVVVGGAESYQTRCLRCFTPAPR